MSIANTYTFPSRSKWDVSKIKYGWIPAKAFFVQGPQDLTHSIYGGMSATAPSPSLPPETCSIPTLSLAFFGNSTPKNCTKHSYLWHPSSTKPTTVIPSFAQPSAPKHWKKSASTYSPPFRVCRMNSCAALFLDCVLTLSIQLRWMPLRGGRRKLWNGIGTQTQKMGWLIKHQSVN